MVRVLFGLLLWPTLLAPFIGMGWSQTTIGSPFALYLSDPTDCRVNVTTARKDQMCIDDNDQQQWRCMTPQDEGNVIFCDQVPEWAQVGPGTGAAGAASCVDPDTANDTYACTPSPPITSYTTGGQYLVKASVANVGSAAVDLNALGSKLIKKITNNITTDLVDGDICAGQWFLMTYDGTNMQLSSPVCNTVAGVVTPAFGGTGQSTTPDNGVIVCDGTTCDFVILAACDPVTEKQVYNAVTKTVSCGTDLAVEPSSAETLQQTYDASGASPSLAVSANGLKVTGLTSASQSLTFCFDSGCTKGKRLYYDNATSQWVEQVFPDADIALNAPSGKELLFQVAGTTRAKFTGSTYSSLTGTSVDHSAATSFRVATADGAAPTVDGDFRYDSLANKYVGGVNGVTKIVGFESDMLPLTGGTLTGALTATEYTSVGTAAGQLTLKEASGSGANFVRLRAPATRATDLILVYPLADPTAGQLMVWSAPSAGVSTGTWADPGAGGGGSGDIESVGTCTTATCFQSETTNKVLASPDGATGIMTPRALVAADLPTVPVSKGGTGLAVGTSGGIPYFSAAGTMASSAALTVDLPVLGGGAGAAPKLGTKSGSTNAFVTTTGPQTVGRCVEIDASGNHVESAGACAGTGPGSGDVVGPASSIDNTIARYSGTTGRLLDAVAPLTVGDLGELKWTDTTLSRVAANVLMLQNGSTAQQLMVANSYTSLSDFSGLSMYFAAGAAIIRTSAATQAAGNLAINYGGSSTNAALTIPTVSNLPVDISKGIALGTSAAVSGLVRMADLAGHGAVSGDTIAVKISPSFTTSSSSTATGISLLIAPTINYANATPGAGHYEALRIAVTETDLQTGTNYLMVARAGTTGATSMFSVTNAGLVTAAGGFVSGTSAGVTLTCTAMPTTMTITGGIITAVTGGTCS